MSSFKELDLDLLKELECPVCMEYMTSSIRMCENGHNVCNSCKSQVPKCPVCRENFIKGRNVTLEKIAAKAIYTCKYRKAGCIKELKINEVICHQSQCLYQDRECPFRKLSDINCPWTGSMSAIGRHVITDHGKDSREHAAEAFEVTLQNFNTAQRYCKAIFTWGRLFYLVWETTFITLYFAVFHVGQKNEAGEYLYDFKISKNREKISITGVCRSFMEAKSDVLKPGGCVTLHYSTVENYLRQNADLLCEIEIRKKGLVEANVGTKHRFVATPLENPTPSENAWMA